MSREIKFRAWDGRKFWYSDSPNADFVFGSKGDGVYMSNKLVFDLTDENTHRYTGLKDKNGKEIYEGDILGQHPYGYFKKDGTKDGRYKGREWQCFEVKWGEWSDDDLGLASGYEYETDGKVAGWNITFGHRSEYDDELKNYEVIGNTYETPDLLTK